MPIMPDPITNLAGRLLGRLLDTIAPSVQLFMKNWTRDHSRNLRTFLRYIWRSIFILPDGKNATAWISFVYYWIWSLACVIPGAIVAAILIQRVNISDAKVQNVLATGLAFGGALFVQLTIAIFSVVFYHALRLSESHVGRVLLRVTSVFRDDRVIFVLMGGCILFVGPPLLAVGATYWYFTHPSVLGDVAATGVGGALILKVLAILANAAIIPFMKSLVTGVLKGQFFDWLRSDD